jgi:hypothetical protein
MVLWYLAAGTAAKCCHSNKLLRQQCLLATAQYACSGVADMLTYVCSTYPYVGSAWSATAAGHVRQHTVSVLHDVKTVRLRGQVKLCAHA